MTGESALRFTGLGKRYGRRAWALRKGGIAEDGGRRRAPGPRRVQGGREQRQIGALGQAQTGRGAPAPCIGSHGINNLLKVRPHVGWAHAQDGRRRRSAGRR